MMSTASGQRSDKGGVARKASGSAGAERSDRGNFGGANSFPGLARAYLKESGVALSDSLPAALHDLAEIRALGSPPARKTLFTHQPISPSPALVTRSPVQQARRGATMKLITAFSLA